MPTGRQTGSPRLCFEPHPRSCRQSPRPRPSRTGPCSTNRRSEIAVGSPRHSWQRLRASRHSDSRPRDYRIVVPSARLSAGTRSPRGPHTTPRIGSDWRRCFTSIALQPPYIAGCQALRSGSHSMPPPSPLPLTSRLSLFGLTLAPSREVRTRDGSDAVFLGRRQVRARHPTHLSPAPVASPPRRSGGWWPVLNPGMWRAHPYRSRRPLCSPG